MGGREHENMKKIRKREKELGQQNVYSDILKELTWSSIFLFLFVLLETHLFVKTGYRSYRPFQ